MAYIYHITNLQNKKFYVGSAIKVDPRWNSHRSKLRRGIHDNIHLQRAWMLYGEESFKFEVVEMCEEDSIAKIEQEYLDKWVGRPECYNILKFAYAPGRGRTQSESHKAKLREIHTNAIFKDSRRNSISESKKGTPCSQAAKLKISESVKSSNRKKGKFTDDQIREIRSLFETKEYTVKQLALIFDSSSSYISQVIRFKKRTNVV